MLFTRRQVANCNACGLHKRATTPKMGIHGEGNLGIVFINPCPSILDDELGNPFSNLNYDYIRSFMSSKGYVMEGDAYWINALNCVPLDDGMIPFTPDKAHLEHCRAFVYDTLKKLKPRLIIPIGTEAVVSLYDNRVEKVNGIEQWRGHVIPDQTLKAWVAPIFSPEWVMEKTDPQAEYVWNTDMENALSYEEKRFKRLPDYRRFTQVLLEFKDVIAFLDKVLETKPEKIFFDYEANHLKPHYPGTKLLTVSMYVPEMGKSYAFPIRWKGMYSDEQLKIMEGKLRSIFESETKFIAHNIPMEDSWTSVKLGVDINTWIWDTCVMQHIIDVTPKTKGLKFQCFVRYGIEGYDNYSKKFMNNDEDEDEGFKLNRLEEANIIKVLEYNAQDSLYTYWLYRDQMKEIGYGVEGNENRTRVADLYNNVTVALARASVGGFVINEAYFEEQKVYYLGVLADIENKIKENPAVKQFKKEKGDDFNMRSADHVRYLFFGMLGFKAKKQTVKGVNKADHEALTDIDHPVAKLILEYRKLDKVLGTYIGQFQRYSVDGMLHPEYLTFIARSGRTCIAKGTFIEVVRDVSKHPEGIPIEQVKPGDLVYCYDKNNNLVLRKVIWAGKTGTKEVCEVHWSSHGGSQTGVLKATPEHRLRMINGRYVRIKDIDLKHGKGYRLAEGSKKTPKNRCMALLRLNGNHRLFVTGKKDTPLDHRFVYEQVFGPLGRDVVHHIDGNHLNNDPSNLQKMSREAHSKYHALTRPEEVAERCRIGLDKARKSPNWHAPSGKENGNYFEYTKLQLLRLLFKAGGRLTNIVHDFDTIKAKIKEKKINVGRIKARFNVDGEFITRGRVKSLAGCSLTEASASLGINYYKAKALFEEMGVPYTRRETRVPNNHIIKNIVYNGEVCDVYDLEVEGEHNFIANGLCVHNSSVSPNFQNLPKRDPLCKKIVRKGIITPQGYHIGEVDYDTLEVKIFACFCKDPALIEYLMDEHSDMHRDQAMVIFMLDGEWQITKPIRFEAKNGWVFALFYGSYWKSCARRIWEKIISQKDLILGKKNPNDPDVHLREHLRKKGIKNLEMFSQHLKVCEEKMWQTFHVTKEYQENAFRSALEKGYVESYFGFRRGGYIERGQIINTPVQGQGCQCLLHSFVQLYEMQKKQKWLSRMAGQIHDSVNTYFHPTEVIPILNTFQYVMCDKMVKENDWLIVPMGIEASVAKKDESWYDVIDFVKVNGVWQTKKGDNIRDVLELPRQRVFR